MPIQSDRLDHRRRGVVGEVGRHQQIGEELRLGRFQCGKRRDPSGLIKRHECFAIDRQIARQVLEDRHARTAPATGSPPPHAFPSAKRSDSCPSPGNSASHTAAINSADSVGFIVTSCVLISGHPAAVWRSNRPGSNVHVLLLTELTPNEDTEVLHYVPSGSGARRRIERQEHQLVRRLCLVDRGPTPPHPAMRPRSRHDRSCSVCRCSRPGQAGRRRNRSYCPPPNRPPRPRPTATRLIKSKVSVWSRR